MSHLQSYINVHILHTEVLFCVLYIYRGMSPWWPSCLEGGGLSPCSTDRLLSVLCSLLSPSFHYFISLCTTSWSSVFTPRLFGGVVRVALDSAPPLAPSVPRQPSVSHRSAQNPTPLPGMCTYHHTPGTGPQNSTRASSDSASISIISINCNYS